MARSSAKSVDPVASLAAQVEALAAMVAALTANAPAVQVATPAKVANGKKSPKGKPAKGAKVYTWKPWACTKFGIPATVGASFAYSGKNGTTDHIVTGVTPDGIVQSVRA